MKNSVKKVLIVGNGSSSVNTNAKNLHKGKDVFRINKFFLEPRPIFGNKIKFLVFPGEPFFIFFINYLVKNKIYDIDIACYKKLHKRFFIPDTEKKMQVWDDFVVGNNCKGTVPGFYDANQTNSLLKYGKITSGPYLVNCAIQMGYTDISIIGLDFYSEKSGERYPIIIPKEWKKISIFEAPFRSVRVSKKKGNSYDQGHSIDADIFYIKSIVKKYKNIKFHIYVDETGPYNSWIEISNACFDNLTIHRMDKSKMANKSVSFCLDDIISAVNEYREKYLWKDRVMNIKHLFAHRRPLLRNFLLSTREKVLDFFN